MGRTHAATGAAVWLAGCGIATSEGVNVGVHHVLVGAAITAYGAVLPDIDMSGRPTIKGWKGGSNVARSMGWPTQVVAFATARFGVWLHRSTRLRRDRVDEDGHRTITHTLLFCVVMTVMFGALGLYGGPVVAAVFFMVATATAVRSLLRPGQRRFRVRVRKLTGKGYRSVWLSRPVSAGLAAAAVMAVWPAPSGWWLGAAVGVGCLMHNLGDALTNTGVPLFFPWKIRGCRWYCIRVRESWRFETKQESRAEKRIFWLCVTTSIASLGMVLFVAWPATMATAAEWGNALVEAFRPPPPP